MKRVKSACASSSARSDTVRSTAKGTLKSLQDNEQIAFSYAEGTNPNGSVADIAGVFNRDKNVLGLMPHPENLIESAHGGLDGRALFSGLLQVA